MKNFLLSLLMLLVISSWTACFPDSPQKGKQKIKSSSVPSTPSKYTKDSLQVYLQDPGVHASYKKVLLGSFNSSEANFDLPEFYDLIERVRNEYNVYRIPEFIVLTKTLQEADGAYSESLSAFITTYIREHTVSFFSLFTRNDVLQEKDLQHWSDFVMMELTTENISDLHQHIANYETLISDHCKGASSDVVDKADEFCTYMEGYIP